MQQVDARCSGSQIVMRLHLRRIPQTLRSLLLRALRYGAAKIVGGILRWLL